MLNSLLRWEMPTPSLVNAFSLRLIWLSYTRFTLPLIKVRKPDNLSLIPRSRSHSKRGKLTPEICSPTPDTHTHRACMHPHSHTHTSYTHLQKMFKHREAHCRRSKQKTPSPEYELVFTSLFLFKHKEATVSILDDVNLTIIPYCHRMPPFTTEQRFWVVWV